MDIYKNVDGLTAEGVAKAHRKDLATQAKHGVEYLKHWYNEEDGTVFCLCRAPTEVAGEEMSPVQLITYVPARREAVGDSMQADA